MFTFLLLSSMVVKKKSEFLQYKEEDCMVHLVYPYKRAEDELMYSLRSFDKYLKADFDVLIIGDQPNAPLQIRFPGFTGLAELTRTNMLHWAPYIQNLEWDTEQNLGKIVGLLIDPDNGYKDSDDIIWVNDDLYLLRDLDPVFFTEPHAIQDMVPLTPLFSDCSWGNKLWVTYDMVRENGFSGYNYETHLPHRFNIGKLRQLCDMYPIVEGSVMLATSYFNTFYPDVPGRFQHVLMLYTENSPNKILKTDLWLNHNQKGYTDYVKGELKQRFPEPSRFESLYDDLQFR